MIFIKKNLKNFFIKIKNLGSNIYKARILSKGRLIVDTYAAAKELVRDTDYNLSMMA